MKDFSPAEIAQELSILSQNGAVIVGGQAVNIWCETYGSKETPPWSECLPFTSADADGFAANKQMLDGVKALEKAGYQVEVFLPEGEIERKIKTGALRVIGPNHTLEINVLREVLPVPPREIEASAITTLVAGFQVRVIHPLHCLESKTISLLELDQTHRNDKKHLVLSVANVRSMLAMLSRRNPAPSIPIIKQLIGDAHSDVAVDLFRRHGIRILDAIPWEDLLRSPSADLIELARQRDDALAKFDSYVQASEEIEALRNNPGEFR